MKIEKGYCEFFGAYAKVYTLSDQTGNVFYVGCTTQKIEARIACHISDARSGKYTYANKRKNLMIRSLDYKLVVKIVDIRWVTSTNAKKSNSKS